MGKRSNELGQVRKEDLDREMAMASGEPQGSFQMASADVLKKRRIVRGRRSKGAGSSPPPPPSNSIFGSVNLAASKGAVSTAKPFGNFSFGATAKAPASAAKPIYPTFAKPAATTAAAAPKTSMTSVASTGSNETNDKLVRGAQNFLKFFQSQPRFDPRSAQQFISTYGSLKMTVVTQTATESTATDAAKNSTGTTPAWDSSRPLFGGAKPLVSPSSKGAGGKPSAAPIFGASSSAATGSSSTKTATPLFGAPPSAATGSSGTKTPAPLFGAFGAPAPAASGSPASKPLFGAAPANAPLFGAASPATAPANPDGFSFNPSSAGAPAAPLPAFKFSTTPTPAVKAAAESSSKEEKAKEATEEDKEEESGELATADDDYEVIFKTTTKTIRQGKYIRGVLKIEKHKESGKYRLVIRDPQMGGVRLNVAISKGMPLTKADVAATEKKKACKLVIITAVCSEEEDAKPEPLRIIVALDQHDKLHDELKKLV